MSVVNRTYLIQNAGITTVITTNCSVVLCSELQEHPDDFKMKLSHLLFMVEHATYPVAIAAASTVSAEEG